MARRPTVTEQTAKPWKAAQLLGFLGTAAGFALMLASPPLGVVVAIAGITAFIAGRLGAWWNHG